MRFTATALLSALAALASAYTQPDYDQAPSGNAISKPGLNEIVTAGQPYSIEWQPSTEGPISLVLLRGPSTNVQPIKTLAESIDNSGSYEWTPSKDLEPDTTHYGLLLVVEGTGQYQYSTQFGVENPEYHVGASSAASSTDAPATTTAASHEETASFRTLYSTQEYTKTICPKCSSEAAAASSATATSAASSTTLSTIPVAVASSSSTTSTSTSTSASSPAVTSSTAAPSDADAVSASATASASSSSSAPSSVFTGAANRNAVGLGAVAAGVLAVLAF